MGKRIGLLDEIRGIDYIAMILYHIYFDIAFVYGHDLPQWLDVIMYWVQPFIAGLFIVLAGISCNFSKNNFKRGALYFFLGMLLTFVTAVLMPSELILFGILHFLGIACLIYGFLGQFTESIPWVVGVVIFSLLYVVTLNIPNGYIGFEGLFTVRMPDFFYGHYHLFPLGFPSRSFASADYFPLIPNLFLFFAGASLGQYFTATRASSGINMTRFRGLAFLGRHGLWIYLLHQPVVIVVLELIFKLTGQNTVFL